MSLAGPATAALGEEAALAEEDLVILEVKLDNFVLGDSLLAYLRRGRLVLPLGELAELLDFAIVVDPHAGRADGWFIRESRGFHLDLSKSEIVLDGVPQGFDPDLVTRDLTELYVDSSLLSRWFGIEFQLKLSYLELRLHPREKLPIQLRLLREELRRRSLSGRGARQDLPRREARYRMASWPSLDLLLQTAAGGGGVQSAYSVFAAADLAG
ncbi:MAG: hypothetical protein V3V67_01680, partial [Myxococcota bacterium]